MKTQFLRSMMLALVVTALALTGCKKSDTPTDGGTGGGGTTAGANTITGTITFLYNGNPVDAAHWPFSSNATDPFPGYVRISLVPANANGQPIGGPAGTFVGTGTSGVTGVKFSDLATGGKLSYTFTGVTNGTYLVNAAFYDPIRNSSTNLLGYLGQATLYAFGTPITMSNNQGISNLNMVADIAVAYSDIYSDRHSSQGTLYGSVKVDSSTLANWPTGSPYTAGTSWMGLTGYKSTNQTLQPDLFVVIPKPANGNVAAFADTTHYMPFGTTYQNVQVDVWQTASPGIFTRKYSTPRASMKTATGDTTFTVSASTYNVGWHSTITLP